MTDLQARSLTHLVQVIETCILREARVRIR
jgi:hypothetical protein